MDRRSLLDDDGIPDRETGNLFDDANEVEDVDFVADGFRPAYNHDREESGRQARDSSATRSMTASPSLIPHITHTAPSRSSTRKSRSRENPFASPEDEDGSEPPLHRTPSGNFAPLPQRSTSSASSSRYARTHSMRFGAGGPSHPYAMYPQDTGARASSIVSTFSAQVVHRQVSREGPQHPYALYPQGITDDSDHDDEAVANPVPLGFLGLGQQFHRRRGPDGEEQDILGFYGHTEQLPPYTRYPEDGPEKSPLLGIPDSPPALHSRAPVLGTDPAMPLMHAQIQPAPQQSQSMTDESELQRQNTRSSRIGQSVRTGNSSQNSLATKKSWSEKSWREKRKTRFCGVPFWAYLVALGCLTFIATVLGAVIGGFVVGQQKAEKHVVTVVSTSLWDASLVATPTATSPSATGTYALEFGDAEEADAGCLTTPNQRAAWSCNLVDGEGLAIDVSTVTGASTDGATLYYQPQASEYGVLYYGTQASSMSTSWEPFLLVVDNDDPHDGLAFYFQGTYDKLVVVPENAILGPANDTTTHTSTKTKREYVDPIATEFPIATPSSKPWFCFFNNTIVEGFIYVHEAAENAPSPTYRSAGPEITSTPAWARSLSSEAAWLSNIQATPTVTITTTITMATATSVYSGIASNFPSWLKTKFPKFNMTEYHLLNNVGGSNIRSKLKLKARNDKRQFTGAAPSDYGYSDTQHLALYPNVVKLEESRRPGGPAPYCVQYQVLNDYEFNWVADPVTGEQIVVHLNEKDPAYSAYQDVGLAGSRSMVKKKRTLVPGSCHCQWKSGA